MDDETNVIEFPTASQPEASGLPFDTIEGVQTALAWMEQLLADSRAAVARTPYLTDPISVLETWVELSQAVIATAPQHGDEVVLQGVNQVFAAAGRMAGR